MIKIAFLGPESSGKTTLAEMLTKKLNCTYHKNSYSTGPFMGEVAISNAIKSPAGVMGLSRLVTCLLSHIDSSKSWNSLIA